MSSSITQPYVVVPPVICDFGWTYGLLDQRLPEFSYNIGFQIYPPGAGVLGGGSPLSLPASTVPTGFGTIGSLRNNFESSGTVVLDNGIAHQSVTYSGLGVVGGFPSFLNCSGGTGTFAVSTPIYDARFYVDALPLNTIINFDAVDSVNKGLPRTTVPTGVTILGYQWDFGNGQTGYGATASTTYTYNIAPPGLQARLTVTDSLGRVFSCAHRLNPIALVPTWGTAIRHR